MKLSVNRAVFEAALTTAVACCGREKALPQLGLVHITSAGDTLYFHATDMDRSVRSQVVGEIEGEFDVYVEGALLSRIVSKLRGETLKVEVKNNKLELKGGVTKLNTAVPASYPQITLSEDANDYRIGFTPAVFTELGKALLLGTSVDETDKEKAYRNVVQIKGSDGTAVGRATDQTRIAQGIAPCSADGEFELLIPVMALRTLFLKASAESEQIRLGEDKNHILAVYGTTLYSFRKTTATFPDLDVYFANLKFDRATCEVTTDAFADSLELAGTVVAQAVAMGARPAIFWEVQDNGIRMYTSNVAGDVDEFVETSVEGVAFSSIYNIHQILPIVMQSGAETLTLAFAEDYKPGIENFPLRISYETTIKASFDTGSMNK